MNDYSKSITSNLLNDDFDQDCYHIFLCSNDNQLRFSSILLIFTAHKGTCYTWY